MTKTFGPYDSAKSAMRANCRISMKGTFAAGLVLTVEGEMMMSTGCKASRDAEGQWFADVTLRPVTDQERESVLKARQQREVQRAAEVNVATDREYRR
jgi:predicted Fe-S protein YdhL (DUF1289 family)